LPPLADQAVELPGIPVAFRWATTPEAWNVAEDGRLTFSAGARTDLFVDPDESRGRAPILNAPRFLGRVDGDFVLSGRVSVDFRATYDAGVLLVWIDERTWAKLCFERSPGGEPMIVSVVTRSTSDDCNSFVVGRSTAWLRIARLGSAYAFHASDNGLTWQFIRYFSLGPLTDAALGFEVQSPTGVGCTATFDEIRFEGRRLADLRDGS
jgi:uncharacterized protein